MTTSRRNLVLFAFLAALWGASYLFIKVALEDMSAPMIVFLRVALAALLMLPLIIHRHQLRALSGRYPQVAFLAALQVAVPFILITVGEHWVSSSLAGILVASAPIFTAIFAVYLDHSERLHGPALVGVAVGMSGVVLLLGVDVSGDLMALVGALMVVLAAMGYALASFYFKRHFTGDDPVTVAGATMAATALYMLIPAALTAPSELPGLDATLSILALGFGGTGIAFVIFYMLMRDMGVSRTSLVAYVAPGFAVVYGVALLDESVGVGTIAGLVLILAGSWLAARGRWPWRADEVPVAPLDPAAAELVIRRAGPGDERAVATVAALDSRAVPAGELLVAERAGAVVAALPLRGGPAVADPFVPTAAMVALLELRREQLRGAPARRAGLRRRRVPLRVPA